MPPQRNMGWRKPVPKLIPDSSSSLARFSTSLKRISITPVDKDVPPIPDDWYKTVGDAVSKEKRHGFILSSDVTPLWMEEGRDLSVSLSAATAPPREDGSDHMHATLPALAETRPQDSRESIATMPVSLRPKRSLPRHYRPPTPPLPRNHAKRRTPAGADPANHGQHGAASGMLSAGDMVSTPRATRELALSGYSSSFHGHSATAVNSLEDLNAPSHTSHAPYKLTHHSSRVRKMSSASSTRIPKRSCESFISMWGDVKSLSFHVRVKITSMFRVL